MIEIGSYNTLLVLELTEHGAYLGTLDEDVLLPGAQVPSDARVGDTLRVFVYTDSEDRPIATTLEPLATVGGIACLKVVDTNHHGAFLDWGLPKDLFAPASLQRQRMRVGDRVVVGLSLHERTNRVIAISKLAPLFDYDVGGIAPGDTVRLMVWMLDALGAHVVVNGRHRGLVYQDWIHQPLREGDELDGYVELVRDDNRLDVRLQRTGRQGSDDTQQVILAQLFEHGGTLHLHDKSTPAEIRRALGVSKKAFKKAVGALYKARVIELVDGGIRRVG